MPEPIIGDAPLDAIEAADVTTSADSRREEGPSPSTATLKSAQEATPITNLETTAQPIAELQLTADPLHAGTNEPTTLIKPSTIESEDQTAHEADSVESDTSTSLWQAFWLPSRSQFLVGMVILLVVMASILHIRARNVNAPYQTSRRADLIVMLDALTQENRKLEHNLAEMETLKKELETGADKQNVARKEAENRIVTLSVLGGTAPAEGPGIELTVYDPQKKITPALLVDCLAELRDAGAEVIEINDEVRVVAQTWVGGQPGAIVVDGHKLNSPYRFKAIGDSHALDEGVRFRGGIVSQVEAPTIGGGASVTRVENLKIRSTVDLTTFKHATPRK